MTDESVWNGRIAPPAELPEVIGRLGALSTSRGGVEIFETTTPFPSTWFLHAYVALLDGQPAMFVTCKSDSSGIKWVHVVWAREDVRGGHALSHSGATFPVQIGRWLFDDGHLTHHSSDRTPAGDRWAHEVGGVLLPLDPKGDPEATARSSKRAFDLLCQVDWPTVPRAGNTSSSDHAPASADE